MLIYIKRFLKKRGRPQPGLIDDSSSDESSNSVDSMGSTRNKDFQSMNSMASFTNLSNTVDIVNSGHNKDFFTIDKTVPHTLINTNVDLLKSEKQSNVTDSCFIVSTEAEKGNKISEKSTERHWSKSSTIFKNSPCLTTFKMMIILGVLHKDWLTTNMEDKIVDNAFTDKL